MFKTRFWKRVIENNIHEVENSLFRRAIDTVSESRATGTMEIGEDL